MEKKQGARSKKKNGSAGESNARPASPLVLGGAVAALAVLFFFYNSDNSSRNMLSKKNGKHFSGENKGAKTSKAARKVGPYTIIQAFDHDSEAFTQGLLVHDGVMYESTGLYGKSTLRKLDMLTGKVLQSVDIDPKLFGEGIVYMEDTAEILMLTWREGKVLLFDAETLELKKEFEMEPTVKNEGWGVTYGGGELIVSDGSNVLHIWDPKTFKEVRRVNVVDQKGNPVDRLNELEYLPEENVVLANVWYKDYIVAINPQTGEVKRVDNMKGLLPPQDRTGKEDCFNGIAFDVAADEFYFTGKNWGKLYKMKRHRSV